MRVAAVDCGTNSLRLLVADARRDGTLSDVLRRTEVVRLGYGVDRTGRLDDAAVARTLARCEEYAGSCRALGVDRVRFVGTSASRDARNADAFVAGVRAVFAQWGTAPEVVSGDEEAAMAFRGAASSVAAAGHPGPYLVVDLGGGSTELVRGTAAPEAGRSFDIGSVRLTERHLHSDPPTPAEVAAALGDVDAALAEAERVVGLAGVRTVVGVAGTVTTVTAHALRLPAYDPAVVHLAALTPAQVREACDDLLAMTRAERAALPYLQPGREDVIGAGALVWREVVARAEAAGAGTVVTSEHDILDGIAASILDRG